jgi:hypothetical protein
MNMSGSPTKLAAAIIDASLRTSRAMPCERPANAIARRAAAPSTTSHPAMPPCTRTPSARPSDRSRSAWITAMIPARTTCERMIASLEAGAARKRSMTWRSRSLIVAMPDQLPPKKAFMQMIPGVRNWMYVDAPPRSAPTREKSCP